MEFALKYRPEERESAVRRLTERLVDGLQRMGKRIMSPLDPKRRSGIVTFQVDDASGMSKRLEQEHVIVAPRVDRLRISPHFYNTEREIDTLLGKL